MVIVLALVFAAHFHPGTGLTSLIRFSGLRREKLAPELTNVSVYLMPNHHGYDGQYYAHLAVHPPWLYHDLASHFDYPSYRARRIFLPLVAYVLGAGNPAWIVHVFALLNVVAWLGLAWLIAQWAPPVRWTHFGRWAGCLLSAGVLESIRGSLTDLPAIALALAALRLYQNRQVKSAAGVFALSLLTRETMAVSAAGILWPSDKGAKTGRRSVLPGLIALLPLVAWSLYVGHYFHNSKGATGNFSLPFAATIRGAQDACIQIARGTSDNGRYVFRLVTLLAWATQIGAVVFWRRNGLEWLRFALGFILLFPLLGDAVWEGPWAIWRTELPVTIAFCMLLPVGRWFWPILVTGSLPSLLALFRLVF